MNTTDTNNETEALTRSEPFHRFVDDSHVDIAIEVDQFASLDTTTIPDGSAVAITHSGSAGLPDELTLLRKGNVLFAICRSEYLVNQFVGYEFSLRNYMSEKSTTARLLRSEDKPIVGACSRGGPAWFYLDWQLKFSIPENSTAILGTLSEIGTALHQETCKRMASQTNTAADIQGAPHIHQPELVDCGKVKRPNASKPKVGDAVIVLLAKHHQDSTRAIEPAWVSIHSITDPAIVGEIDRTLHFSGHHHLYEGDTIQFELRHIFQVDVPLCFLHLAFARVSGEMFPRFLASIESFDLPLDVVFRVHIARLEVLIYRLVDRVLGFARQTGDHHAAVASSEGPEDIWGTDSQPPIFDHIGSVRPLFSLPVPCSGKEMIKAVCTSESIESPFPLD